MSTKRIRYNFSLRSLHDISGRVRERAGCRRVFIREDLNFSNDDGYGYTLLKSTDLGNPKYIFMVQSYLINTIRL